MNSQTALYDGPGDVVTMYPFINNWLLFGTGRITIYEDAIVFKQGFGSVPFKRPAVTISKQDIISIKPKRDLRYFGAIGNYQLIHRAAGIMSPITFGPTSNDQYGDPMQAMQQAGYPIN